MLFGRLIDSLLPQHLKNNKFHPDYEETHMIINGCLWSGILITIIYIILYINHFNEAFLLYNGLSLFCVLPFFKWNLHRQAFFVNSILLYVIYFPFFLNSGGIFSVNIATLYLFLLGALYGQPTFGIWYVGTNSIFLVILYFLTPSSPVTGILGSKLYSLLINISCTGLMGPLFLFIQKKKDTLMVENKKLQNLQISNLNEEVTRRNKELNNMRQTLAADFHDETGNILSAITRQASILKMKLNADSDTLNIVENIISNSNQLYTSSRHFIWNLNNDSDDPVILFDYITSFGQFFYNQFDIDFSAENNITPSGFSGRLESFAAINLIFIFKEAMNNVAKHSGAKEVFLKMSHSNSHLQFVLTDDGKWKSSDDSIHHEGLKNMEKRCQKNNFRFELHHQKNIPTSIRIEVPVI